MWSADPIIKGIGLGYGIYIPLYCCINAISEDADNAANFTMEYDPSICHRSIYIHPAIFLCRRNDTFYAEI